MEDDPEYRQALREAGHDPDDPRVRTAIADVVGLLEQIAEEELSGADPVISCAERALMHNTIADAFEHIRQESAAEATRPQHRGVAAGHLSRHRNTSTSQRDRGA
ncbi:hypothetical protein [Rhodococcoides kyotonense]|uniref:Uncharacterized protein n=1 Tax=Rhodococcoides kyotonense TaxID=398843 RepID=A0A177YEM7_9NOCA|nr:hypothetical protein [Rhodococcus kyotonensis]OAK53780.1 hypothetical protein A3K89_21900 [Rhodococcus kyotonensis]